MGQVMAVLSGKGGTGKTAFCANTGVSLCARGQRVLLVDADAGLRNLDIVLGLEGKLLFTYRDVMAGNASLKEASVPHPVAKTLRVLTAPGSGEQMLDSEALAALFDRCREHFDFTLVDCPAGLGEAVLMMGALADQTVVVATPDATSLRGAQAAALALEEQGQRHCRLAINRARRRLMSRGDTAGVDQAMDAAGLPLLGVVPEDQSVMISANRGDLLHLSSLGPAVAAYNNIAARLCGQRVPLFEGIKGF